MFGDWARQWKLFMVPQQESRKKPNGLGPAQLLFLLVCLFFSELIFYYRPRIVLEYLEIPWAFVTFPGFGTSVTFSASLKHPDVNRLSDKDEKGWGLFLRTWREALSSSESLWKKSPGISDGYSWTENKCNNPLALWKQSRGATAAWPGTEKGWGATSQETTHIQWKVSVRIPAASGSES